MIERRYSDNYCNYDIFIYAIIVSGIPGICSAFEFPLFANVFRYMFL